MKVSDFTYNLSEELIAQYPPKQRGASRLLVLDKETGNLAHKHYSDFADYVRTGDVVVLNDTKVIKARLVAKNAKGQARELLLLEDHHNTNFTRRKVLYRGKIQTGEQLIVRDTSIKVEAVYDNGVAEISTGSNLLDLAEIAGSVPLPPYMHRKATSEDAERYQTIFAREPGSVAAPTASLNFTQKLQDKIVARGGKIVYLTLHVGLGTFLPIRTDEVQRHKMHSEYFEIPPETTEAVRQAKAAGNKIFAVGTTVTRTLEYAYSHFPSLIQDSLVTDEKNVIAGEADIFIYPGYAFKIVDSLVTNFHAPKTTVLMLAAAFAGWQNLENAYKEAMKKKYAFLSYGDSMLII